MTSIRVWEAGAEVTRLLPCTVNLPRFEFDGVVVVNATGYPSALPDGLIRGHCVIVEHKQ
jgi:hypothetical protein